jgi:acetyl esterase/lipase
MPTDGPDGEDRSVLYLPAAEPSGTWTYGSHPDQVADVYLPEPAIGHPLVLVHGGFWRPEYDRTHLRPLAEALRAAGYPVLSLEYRRVPGHPDGTIDDLRAALTHLRDDPPKGYPRMPATLIGHSAGGHLVLLLAGAPDRLIRSVIALAPVADLALAERLGLGLDAVRAFLGTTSSARPDLDPSALPPPSVPVSIIHGALDHVVPMAVSRSYDKAIGGRGRLIELAATGHFELIDPRSDAFGHLLTVADRTGIE